MLRSVASQVFQLTRTEDVLARYGGEEFVILVRGIERAEAVECAERIRKRVAETQIRLETCTLAVTLNIGVSMLSEVPETPAASELVALADKRVYEAKANGRNCTRSGGESEQERTQPRACP